MLVVHNLDELLHFSSVFVMDAVVCSRLFLSVVWIFSLTLRGFPQTREANWQL